MMQLHQVTLSLGSNLGDRYERLLQGMRFLFTHGLTMVDCSGVYETVPVGYTQQPDFLNMVLQAETALEPFALLEVCQAAEKDGERERTIPWGPRTLDIDILFYDDLVLELPELTIPHPRIAQRAFVLGPLAEMNANLLEKWGYSLQQDGIALSIPASEVTRKLS